MANLVIDIGNTNTKIAVFEHNELLFAEHYKETDIQTLNTLLQDFNIGEAIISTVKKDSGEWETVLKEKTSVIYFNTEMTAGISNHYLTPKTLGPDRLAAIIGASQLYPGKSSLVIDGGTCITYDYVDAKANYAGGSISPGLNMRFKAMNNYTAVLPLLNADKTFGAEYGSDTRGAMLSGVQNGIKYELTGFIESYRNYDNQLNIILTGGDSIFFDRLLKNSIFAPYIKIEPHLVLKGLNAAIQQHND
jgi:type III pantothenate kinase